MDAAGGSLPHVGLDGGHDFNRAWIDGRRGGGGGIPIARPLGTMMLILAGLSVGAHVTKQSTFAAALVVGIIFAAADLPTHHETVFESEVTVMLNEFGMAIVLFFGGISVDVDMLRRYWSAVIVVGPGMAVACAGLFALVSWGIGLCEEAGSIFFFGVACSLTSQELLHDFEARHGSRTLHVKLMNALMLSQDFITVIAVTVLHAFERSLNPVLVVSSCSSVANAPALPSSSVANASDTTAGHRSWARHLLSVSSQGNLTNASNVNASHSNVSGHTVSGEHGAPHEGTGVHSTPGVSAGGASVVANVTGNQSCVLRRMTSEEAALQGEHLHDFCSLGGEIGSAIGIGILVLFFFWLMMRYFNGAIVRQFMKDGELLFICAMAYSLGTCGMCHLLGFSHLAGAYIAGLSLSFHPSRVQINSKIQALRTLGRILFCFSTGIVANVKGHLFVGQNFGWAVLIAVLVVLVQPIFMIFCCWFACLKCRSTVYTALLHNSLGERSIIVMVVAQRAGVFSEEVLAVLVTAVVFSITLSAAGILFVDNVHKALMPLLTFLERPSESEKEREAKLPCRFQGHVVLLGFNETGLEVAEFFRKINHDVVMCDLDPVLHTTFLWSYKGTGTKRKKQVAPGSFRMRQADAAQKLDQISPDGVRVHGANMGPTKLDEVDHETYQTHATLPLAASPLMASVSSSTTDKHAIEMTTSPVGLMSEGPTPASGTVQVNESPASPRNHDGEVTLDASGDTADHAPKGKQDLHAILEQFKLHKDAEDIKANGVNAMEDLFEIEPAMLPDLILSPIAKAKLKKLLRHVNAPGWKDEKPTSSPFSTHANPHLQRAASSQSSPSHASTVRPGEAVPALPKSVLASARPGSVGSEVSFSSRGGLGSSPSAPSGRPAPQPPPRAESFARTGEATRPPAPKFAESNVLRPVCVNVVCAFM